MEPTPASVSSSMRMECFFRPSRIWALLTPLRTAWNERYHSAFTSVGSGVVDIRGCMKAALEFGLTWGIMEQDAMNQLSPMDSLRASYYNVKEYGLAE